MAINVTTTWLVSASITASTISFTAPDTISDSGSGFGIFSPWDYIVISWSASNDKAHKILTASATTLTLEWATVWVGSLVNEVAWASITIAAWVWLYLSQSINYPGEPVVLVHPSTTDLRDTLGFYAYEIAVDSLLAAWLDAATVTMDADGKTVTTWAELKTLGSWLGTDNAWWESLEETLAIWNKTWANDIDIDVGQKINFGSVGNEGDVSMEQDGADETLNVQTKYWMIINATDAIGLTDIGGTYLAVTEPSTGNSLQIDSTGATQITRTQNFGAGSLLLKPTTLSGSNTQLLQNAAGTIALLSDIPATADSVEVAFTSAASWVVNHNKGHRVTWTAYDGSGNWILPWTVTDDGNTLTLNFAPNQAWSVVYF